MNDLKRRIQEPLNRKLAKGITEKVPCPTHPSKIKTQREYNSTRY